jgi:hypothetical protein
MFREFAPEGADNAALFVAEWVGRRRKLRDFPANLPVTGEFPYGERFEGTGSATKTLDWDYSRESVRRVSGQNSMT